MSNILPVEPKKAYLSKTIIASQLLVLVGIVGALGFIPENYVALLQSNFEYVLMGVGLLGTVLRLVTKGAVELY